MKPPKGDAMIRLVDDDQPPSNVPRHKGLRRWTCNICESDIGSASSVTIVVTMGGFIDRGKFTGGHKRRVCAACPPGKDHGRLLIPCG